ncbi:MAG: V-type ATP synthase subunit A, partial [Candidatus Aenigmarchaeota archaeon]|nr:V-type ATP synthase subunit A [Candidatus Aenigmarchaeota archaeon]
ISSRLEEMPGEEGYPAHLASRLAEFYERSGRVVTLGSKDKIGSVSIIGAVSPPGGDFSEPVTQNTLKITRVFWALDTTLADRRHFPAINWLTSYSLYKEHVSDWYEKEVSKGWLELRDEAMTILQKESELREIVQLVGPDALPGRERLLLEVARMIREDFLQQNAYHDVDTFCDLKKQYEMLKAILKFYEKAGLSLAKGIDLNEITKLDVIDKIARMKELKGKDFEKRIDDITKDLKEKLG